MRLQCDTLFDLQTAGEQLGEFFDARIIFIEFSEKPKPAGIDPNDRNAVFDDDACRAQKRAVAADGDQQCGIGDLRVT